MGINKNPLWAEEYFGNQQALCCSLLHAYGLKKKTEDLHQLRVAIKRIRAVLRMLHKLQPEFNYDRNAALYKNIFKRLGPVREEHLQQERLKKQITGSKAKVKPLRIIAALNKELILASPRYLKSIKSTLPAISNSLHNLEREAIYPYCRKLLKHLTRKWKNVHTSEELHQYRKQLKQFLYCAELLTGKEKSKLISAAKFEHIDKLQHIIGLWHDNVLLLAKISKEGLAVNPEFLHNIQTETKFLLKKAHRDGNKI